MLYRYCELNVYAMKLTSANAGDEDANAKGKDGPRP